MTEKEDDAATKDVWNQVFLAIASLDASSCTEEEIRAKLDPLLSTVKESEPPNGISPLLVASDKGNLKCLEYLLSSHYPVSVIGSPVTPSDSSHGGNTPVHHAAMAGCSDAWPIFAKLMADDEAEAVYVTLGSLSNVNGDTPLQMAIPAGHGDFVRQFWSGNATLQARKILQRPNQQGDTCASLACCHGHVDILDFLLTTCQVQIRHEEVESCQSTVDRMDGALQSVTDPQVRASFKDKQTRVHACLTKLKDRLDQQVAQAAQELMLLQDNNEGNHVVSATSGTNKKKKKKRKSKGNSSNNKQTTISKQEEISKSADQEEDSFCVVSRLEDGRVAVTVKPTASQEDTPILPQASLLLPTASPQTMLRQRMKENHVDKDVDAVMDALCLDVSMLLYTPHGMALNLSPSQLDTVEQILQKQSQSVRRARELQQRIHSVVSSSETDDDQDNNNNNNNNECTV
ncbi:Ankyrin Repeat [Seminavis robusta]|uniref:Ankyrin Repeat n=1 Tax=Seminavis robusta TaxID=568900 RepID=A0A9N8E8M3_9STRA|nr:Ankyrin Repeat [Seminavis robusta]|eukprot:Sro792_g203160.1 Ankyrin Repeat (459) ;mRNA; f:36014-37390